MPDSREIIFPLGVPLIQPDWAEARQTAREEANVVEPPPLSDFWRNSLSDSTRRGN